MSRRLPAPPGEVFRAFADGRELEHWWGPEGFATVALVYDPRPGASYRLEMRPPDGDPFHLTGDFREVDPPRRLAYTFLWQPPDPDDAETLVVLAFRERAGETDVRFTQGRFKTEARRELHRNGWSDTFAKLERFLKARR